MSDLALVLIDGVISQENGAHVPSPCCGGEMCEPYLRTAICLGCGETVDLWQIDWTKVAA